MPRQSMQPIDEENAVSYYTERELQNPMHYMGLMSDVPHLPYSGHADLFKALEVPTKEQFDWVNSMDQGSHNTLFTTSSEGLFDELNTAEDPHTSGCWKMQSSTAECKDIGNSMDTIQHSSSAHISQEFNDLAVQPLNPASEALEIIAMLGANAFDHSFVKNLMAESDREAMVYPEPELPAMFTSQPSMYQMDLFGDNWMQSLSNLQQPMMNEYDSLPPLQTMNSTLSLYGTGTNSSSIDKKSKTSRKRPEIINSRRKTVQHEMSCNHCNGHLGLAFLRGAYSCDKELPVSISCQSCSEIHAKDDEHRRMGKLIECEICHCNIGSGFLDVCSEDELKSEFVCGGCGDKYMFCSECGGGGKQRTGKWRPKELFEQGRRTCSLPHIRVGTAELHYSTIPVEQLTTEVLLGVQEVFFDCMFSLYCIPSIMANYKYDSFEMIKRDIEQLWLKSVLDVLTNKVLNGKKYVSVAWIHKRHRNKGVGRSSTTKDTVPWLQKLGISGIINPPADLTAGDSEERNHCFVAFSIAEWLPHTQSIFLAQMAPRSVFLKTMDGYIDLIKYSIDRIKEDAENIGYHVPRHIWCWAKGDHARLQSIPGRLRFVAKEDYLATQKGLDPDFFERPAYEPLNARGTLVFATSIKIFNSKSK